VTPIPLKLREELSKDPFMQVCIMPGCGSKKVEWHHPFLYMGKRLNARWSIVPACYKHHRGGHLDMDYTRYVALQRATDEELAKYPRVDWRQMKSYLNAKYS